MVRMLARGIAQGRWLVALACLLSGTLACRGLVGPTALVFSPDQLPPATTGQPYHAVISVTQNVTPVFQMSVDVAKLPPGLSFAFLRGQNAAEITGTPLQAGSYKFTVTALCYGTNVAGQTGGHDYQLVVQ